MLIEGFVMLEHRGRYAIYSQDGISYELKNGDRIEVDMGKDWIEMQVSRDLESCFLKAQKISFYPKMVYARLITQEDFKPSEN
jgi:hypothetical protein